MRASCGCGKLSIFKEKSFYCLSRILMFTVFIITVNIKIVTLFTTCLLVFLCPHQLGHTHRARCLRKGKKV